MSNNKNEDSNLYLTAYYVLVCLVFIYVFGHLHPNIFRIFDSDFNGFTSLLKTLTPNFSELDKQQFIDTISILSGGAFLCLIVVIFYLILVSVCAVFIKVENTGGLDTYTWEKFTIYKKTFLQNKDKITGSIDMKEYYKLVVEYNLCSCTERRLEIVAVFTERNWGQPFLEEFKREPFTLEEAELKREKIEQIKLLVLPCPECLTDIDCNTAQDNMIYECHRCAVNYKFKNDVGLIIS